MSEDLSVAEIIESQRLFTETKGEQALIEIADGSTVFLDEIEKFSLPLQIEIRWLLELKPYVKPEERFDRIKNIRFVFATKTTLSREMPAGTLIEFLLHRLNVVHIKLPPLRVRKTDIPLLTRFAIEKFNPQFKKDNFKIPEAIVNLFLEYQWPGNIKELENVIRRATFAGIRDFSSSVKMLIGNNRIDELFMRKP